MRLLPPTLAGRTSLLLVAGFAIAATATFFASGWSDTARILARIGGEITALDRLPAEDRARAAAALGSEGIHYTWLGEAGAETGLKQDATTRHLERDLRVALSGTGLDDVRAGYAAQAADVSTPYDLVAWVALRDGSRVRAEVRGELLGALSTPRVVLTASALAVSLVALAIWAARRVTGPLRRFATAAQTLGANLGASPLDESGPNEIRDAARAFNQMQRKIRGLVDERTLMLAAISHDLRTCLTRLRLRVEAQADLPQRERAVRDLDEMGAMLETTLAYARGDGHAEPTTRVDLAVLLQSLCDEAVDAGERATYSGPSHLAFRGQPVALRRAFDNLIVNAIKYGDEAAVTLASHLRGLEISIADRGPGIAPEYRERVFEPFFRIEGSRSRETGGAGLGLAVAKKILVQHGGMITIGQHDGGGIVTVHLPAQTDSNG